MTDLRLSLRPRDIPHRWAMRSFRTLLCGEFAAPGCGERRMLERMLRVAPGGRAHSLLGAQLPAANAPDAIAQAERHLARETVDIVLIDLRGPLMNALSLVGRLRAASRGSVVFVGVMPDQADQATCLYLAAVLDALVERPFTSCILHAAIADALHRAADFAGRSQASTPISLAVH